MSYIICLVLQMDGDASTLPVIFEDQYQHVAEFARRRSIVSRKSGELGDGRQIEESAFSVPAHTLSPQIV